MAILQAALFRPFHQQQITGALANVVRPHALDIIFFALLPIFKQLGIEWL